MTDRAALIAQFLAAEGWQAASRGPLAGDASFRRYERLTLGGRRAILMDAPPPQEDVSRFIRVACLLTDLGLSAPRIFAAETKAGLLLLEDFGDATYTRLLAAGEKAEPLYRLGVDVLIEVHRRFDPRRAPGLRPYDEELLLDEAARFVDWYLRLVTGATAAPPLRGDYLERWRAVLPLAQIMPATLVLRDFHAGNLMRLDDRTGLAACGLLDFQDAVLGPPAFDLVSLLEDERREVGHALRQRMIARYLTAFPAIDRDAFAAAAAVIGAQRHAKNIGQFARLALRDGKPHYLEHIPHMWRLLAKDLAHPALAPVRDWFDTAVPPAKRRLPDRTPA